MSQIIEVLKRTLEFLPSDLRQAAEQAIADSERAKLIHEKLNLTPTETRIFEILAANPGVAVKFTDLGVDSLNSLWVHKRRLMIKLEDKQIGTIKTELKEGYRLVLWSHE